MQIGPFTVLHHTEITSAYSYVVFIARTMERATYLGKRGGFTTLVAAVDAATKQARFGTVNV